MKIFNISFQRTGTSSFHFFMKNNGFKSLHSSNECHRHFRTKGTYLKDTLHEINNMTPLDNLINRYDCFSDNPWMMFYEYLEKKYPTAKFILSLRDSYSWISSMIRIMGGVTPSYWEPILYGTNGDVIFNEKKVLNIYETHIKNVTNFFENKKEKILIYNLNENNEEITKKIERFIGFKSKVTFGNDNATKNSGSSEWVAIDNNNNRVNHWIAKISDHNYKIPSQFKKMNSHIKSVNNYVNRGITYNVTETLNTLKPDIERVDKLIESIKI
jgi:hypothetical protein